MNYFDGFLVPIEIGIDLSQLVLEKLKLMNLQLNAIFFFNYAHLNVLEYGQWAWAMGIIHF